MGIAVQRLVKDYERLPATVAGMHFVAFACLFLTRQPGFSARVHNTLDIDHCGDAATWKSFTD